MTASCVRRTGGGPAAEGLGGAARYLLPGQSFFKPPSRGVSRCASQPRRSLRASLPCLDFRSAHVLSCSFAHRSLATGSYAASHLDAAAMALSQKEVRRLPCSVWPDQVHRVSGKTRADAVPPGSARAAQADIQMMLAAQCHLGTKCAPEAVQAPNPKPRVFAAGVGARPAVAPRSSDAASRCRPRAMC